MSSADGLINRDFLLVSSEKKMCVLSLVFICLLFFWNKKAKATFSPAVFIWQQNMLFFLLLMCRDR